LGLADYFFAVNQASRRRVSASTDMRALRQKAKRTLALGGAYARQRLTTCTKQFFHFFEKIFLKGEKKSHFPGI
jgi:hypothetical protein